ncbi:cellulase family glycosylhydrolase [Actinoplanes sp. GCM10030250]|uniref:cellulase family glycosylhydrolase n=1 Tax=Actinoplanes sp. GCM10030250 TaxID=3273376 RepID=UPI0036218565
MKRRLATIGAALLAAATSVLFHVAPAYAATGLHVVGTDIVEANGQKFVMRGINHMHTWYAGQTNSFADIKAAGANTLRVVLSGGRWTANSAADVTNVISLCKANKLICVLENHDTTGYGEDAAAYSLDQAADYWIGLKSVLAGQEDYVVINIGNEPIGNTNAGQWTAATVSAIQKMRTNGFEHLLMIDAPNWGQDWQYVMRDNAQTVLDADTRDNTVLSIHMYSVFNTASSITSYLDHFKSRGWPLVIGEFGWRFDSSQVDHETILSEAVARNLGYLGWSWAGNTDPILDMTNNFNAAQLTTWGERIFNGANGIKATAKQASIFGGTSSPSPSSSSSPSPSPSSPSPSPSSPSPSPSSPSPSPSSPSPSPSNPSSGACTAAYAVTGQWTGGFQGEVKVTAGSSAITGWTVTWTYANGQTVTSHWSSTITSSGSTVTARNATWNGRLSAGATTSFGFLGSWTGSNPTPTLTCTPA